MASVTWKEAIIWGTVPSTPAVSQVGRAPWRRLLRDDAAGAGPAAGDEAHGGPSHADGGSVDPRRFRLQAGVVQEKARFHVVAPVNDQVASFDEPQDVCRRHVGHHGIHGHRCICAGQLAGRRYGLGEGGGDVIFIEERLALQVVKLDEVPIHNPHETAPGADKEGKPGQCPGHRRPSPARGSRAGGAAPPPRSWEGGSGGSSGKVFFGAHSSIVPPPRRMSPS